MKKFTFLSVKNVKLFNYQSIKTYEDACKRLNLDPTKIPDTSIVPLKYRRSIIAYHKLLIIHEALNDGWTPDWYRSSQIKFYVWLSYEKLGVSSTRAAAYPGRLCCKHYELAQYIADTFKSEYWDYFLFPK
jgi:hypothetical protein